MSMGKPVLCLNHGGPGSMVNESTGIKVDISKDKKNIIADLASGLDRLANDPELRHRMGLEAVKLVNKNYRWIKKIELVDSLYKDISKTKELLT